MTCSDGYPGSDRASTASLDANSALSLGGADSSVTQPSGTSFRTDPSGSVRYGPIVTVSYCSSVPVQFVVSGATSVQVMTVHSAVAGPRLNRLSA
jgi:hypothetical protein